MSDVPSVTPGPWEVDPNGNVWAPSQRDADGDSIVVAEVYELADAYPIAKVPDMLTDLARKDARIAMAEATLKKQQKIAQRQQARIEKLAEENERLRFHLANVLSGLHVWDQQVAVVGDHFAFTIEDARAALEEK